MGNVANLRPFKPGESGNPGGRAVGARNKLQGDFLHALAEDFAAHGVDAIREARERNPNQYINAIARLMPRELNILDPTNVADEDVLAAVKAAIAGRTARAESPGESAHGG